jgi:twitching motility protein PilT
MHTIDSTGTINRLLDLFPAQQQREVRMSFAGALRAIVSQRLVKRADSKGRVPAVEVLVSTGRVYDRIIDPEATIEIRDVTGCRRSTRPSSVWSESGLVTEEAARFASTSPHDFVLALRGTLTRS